MYVCVCLLDSLSVLMMPSYCVSFIRDDRVVEQGPLGLKKRKPMATMQLFATMSGAAKITIVSVLFFF